MDYNESDPIRIRKKVYRMIHTSNMFTSSYVLISVSKHNYDMIRLLARPPSLLSPISKLSLFLSLPVCRRSSLLTGEEEGIGGGAKSYDGEKAWTTLTYSILSIEKYSHLSFWKVTLCLSVGIWTGNETI